MTLKSEIKIKKFMLVYIIGLGLIPLKKSPPINLDRLKKFLDDLKNRSEPINGMGISLQVEDYWIPMTNTMTNVDKECKKYDYFSHLIELDKNYFTPALRIKNRYIRIKFRPVEVYIDNNESVSSSQFLRGTISNTINVTPLLFLHVYGISLLTLVVDLKLDKGEIFIEDLINIAVALLRKIPVKIRIIQDKQNSEVINGKGIEKPFVQLIRSMFREVLEKSTETNEFAIKIFDKNELEDYKGGIPVSLIILSLWNYTCSCPNSGLYTTKMNCGEKECPLLKKYAHLTMIKRTLREDLIPSYGVLRDLHLKDYLGKNISFVNDVRCFVHWGGALHLVDNNNYREEQVLEQLLTLVWLEELTLFTGYLLITYNEYFWKFWSRLRKNPKISRKISPIDLANLRDELLDALEEFHGISLVRDYLIKNTLHYLKKHLGIYRDYNSLVLKINNLADIIETRHDEDIKNRGLLLTFLVGALSLSELASVVYLIMQNVLITWILIFVAITLYTLSMFIILDIITMKYPKRLSHMFIKLFNMLKTLHKESEK